MERTRAVSFSKRRRRDIDGLGRKDASFFAMGGETLSVSAGCSALIGGIFGELSVIYETQSLLHPRAGMLPLPTMLLQVSGRNTSSVKTKALPRIVRSQNTHLQPALSDNGPPITGPRIGPRFVAVGNN